MKAPRNPKADGSDYSPKHAAHIDSMLEQASMVTIDTSKDLTVPLRSLIKVLESALRIGYKCHYQNEPQPYPGAAKTVLEQALMTVHIARKSGLLK